MASVVLENLSLGYAGRTVVRRLDGAFADGKATAIVGPNGAGKSTLLKALAGLVLPMAGRVRMDSANRRDIAYLAQDSGIDRSFPIALEDLVALGLQARLGLYRGVGASERRALETSIAAVGLGGLELRPIATLSGGQFQRALFARVMAQDSPLILLDEPFAAQDARTIDHLATVVRRWSAEGRTLILVLHDLDLARALCAETLVLAGEVVAWGPTTTTLTPEILDRAHALAAAAVEA
jgi:zinc/manganese transport system ATP-binding protein